MGDGTEPPGPVLAARRAGAVTQERSDAMRVLVATDGSDNANAATEWLATFPLPAAAEWLVLAAADLTWAPLAIPPLSAYDQAIVEAARRAAEDARAVIERRWNRIEVRVPEGDPRAVIPEHADKWRADLVVVGARGLGAIGGFLLGSVSTAVVHGVRCPVLVVKDRPCPLRRALIAIDGSMDALAAARFFARLPLDPGLATQLIGVVERVRIPHTAPAFMTPVLAQAIEGVLSERRAKIDEALDRVEAEIERGVRAVERLTPVGLPADEIIEAARAGDVDLVVIGARGLGTIKRLLLGSVSERVLHRVECSVLVVKGAVP
jgi:nucleotide-binding universal stress UspA family protein